MNTTMKEGFDLAMMKGLKKWRLFSLLAALPFSIGLWRRISINAYTGWTSWKRSI